MFSPSVVKLHQFYASGMGEAVRYLIGQAIRRLWPDMGTGGGATIGIGFAMPYLVPCLKNNTPLLICMPAEQGAIYWPSDGENVVCLAHESELPLAENSVERALLVHSVEHSEELSGLMRELFRVLSPGGRVIVAVPNRLSLWSRASASPFGDGRPFTAAQARALLSEHQLTPTRTTSALFTPPIAWRWLWRLSSLIEILGRALLLPLGGVLLIEAEKQIYAAIREPVTTRRSYRRLTPVRAGAAAVR